MKLNKGLWRVISSVLSNLAAGWIGSIVIFPGIFDIKNLNDLIILLTYSSLFATLAMYLASKIENKYLI